MEVYEENKVIELDQVEEKIVNIKNIGTVDMFVRVKLTSSWLKNDKTKMLELRDDMIKPIVDTKHWIYDEEDHYYYYQGVIKPEEVTKYPLMTGFIVSGGQAALGEFGKINVHMECVQAAGNGSQIWDKAIEDFGVTEEDIEPGAIVEPSYVTFKNKTDGFLFKDDKDLFISFKNMVPGETRSQIIELKNQDVDTVDFYLYAKLAEDLSQENQSKVSELLKKYLTIQVINEDGTLLYDGPIWSDVNQINSIKGMKYAIYLGSYKSNEHKKLTVQMHVDPDVDNDFEALMASIDWIFQAEGDETASGDKEEIIISKPSVSTGVSQGLPFYAGTMMISAVAFVICVIKRKKK